jgi:ABC-2 type transport system ATP-binding protein
MSSAVRLEGVTKRYGRARGVDDLDLDIEVGEIFGYLGPNGAGKTTTMRMLLDLIRPTSGSITVLGQRPGDVPVRRRVGYLPGELNLYEGMTGADLVSYFDHLRGGGSSSRARALAGRLQLDLDRKIGELSRGNKQKVGLVQAFMHTPELLVLDEPTTGLDPLMQQEFYALVKEVNMQGATVFLSSHVLSEVERVSERVGIIREGRLVEVSDLDDLRARAVRHFEITFDGPVDVKDFEDITGVSDASVSDHVLSCRVTGSADGLIKALSRYHVHNLISHGADLEELFLSYYSGEAVAR